MHMNSFEGKVAVITGGASGIGYALASEFAKNGAKIVIADIEEAALEKTERELSGIAGPIAALKCDVRDFEELVSLREQVIERFGKVHIVVNNAGVSITGPIWQLSLDDWHWVYDVNVWGVVNGVKAFVPLMIEQGEGGHVINTASLAAFNGIGEHAVYSSSKAAVHSMSQALHSEMAAHQTGIGVTCLCPGMVSTDIHKSWRNRPSGDQPWSDREWNDEAHRQASDIFQGQGIEADEVARLTLDAVLAREFYVFTGEYWQGEVKRGVLPAVERRNPSIYTWGADLRSAEEKVADLRSHGLDYLLEGREGISE